MKILLVLGDSRYGGATYLILSWCRFLLENKCEVTVLSTDPVTIAELERLPGLKVLNSILIPRDIAPFTDTKALCHLVRFLAQERFDIVHTHTSTPGFIGRLAAWITRTPVRLHTAHGWSVSEFSSQSSRLLLTPLEYLAALLSTRVICVSHATASLGRLLHLAPESRLVTVCNGIDPQPFVEAANNYVDKKLHRSWNIPEDHLLIGSTGRLSAQKDIDALIRSLVYLNALIPETAFTLLLAGDGPDRETLEELVHALGLHGQVRFLGFYTDIPKFLAALDIFVSPSLWEGLSISIMEAMASARSIVTTNILPNAELIEHEVTGLLVPPRQPEQVAHAIARFVSDPNLAQRCGAAARQRVLDRYTIDRMFQETWDLYVQLLAEKRIART